MKTAYIVSTGTELLLGDTEDTNALFLSRQLSAMGIRVNGRSTAGDNDPMIERAFVTGFDTADIVISSGGMGPTLDDLTREIACRVLDAELVLNENELERIQEFFRKRQREMPAINRKQAYFPADAEIFQNLRGSASGFMVQRNQKVLIMLPGPPRELEPMFLEQVKPALDRIAGLSGQGTYARTLRLMGPGESQVEEMISEVVKQPDGCGLALLAKEGEVHVRVSKPGNLAESKAVVDGVVDRIRRICGISVYGEEDQTLAQSVVSLLAEKGMSLATAESCTGGLLGKLLTDVSGSSDVYWGGIVSYSNDAKMKLLGVKESTLSAYGAVSGETALEMAEGAKEAAGTDYALSMTGIAGPGGGTAEKPVGLVYLGLAGPTGTEFREMRYLGGRDAVRILTAKSALDWLRRKLEEYRA